MHLPGAPGERPPDRQAGVKPGFGSEHEVRGLELDLAREGYGHLRLVVGVGVDLHHGLAAGLDEADLAHLAEGCLADEGEGLIAALAGTGVDLTEVNAVLASLEVLDRIGP